MKAVIIADSGGTKTDWCLIGADGSKNFIETRSYHPALWKEEIASEQRTFWAEHSEWLSAPLFFFGSGCFRPEPAARMKAALKEIGFQSCKVASDVHAAAIAVLGKQPGFAAILGTGSVLCEWNGEGVVRLIGGRGHLEGDEGSGYYFGRLLVERYFEGRLASVHRKSLEDVLGDQLTNPDLTGNKEVLSKLAKVFGAKVDLEEIHRENIQRFVNSIKAELPEKCTVHFVGSYAAAFRSLLEQILNDSGLISGRIIAKPITSLVEQRVYFID